MKMKKGWVIFFIGSILFFLLISYLEIYKLDYYKYNPYILSRYVKDSDMKRTYYSQYQFLNNFKDVSIIISLFMFIYLLSFWKFYEHTPNLKNKYQKRKKLKNLLYFSLIIIYLVIINFFVFPSQVIRLALGIIFLFLIVVIMIKKQNYIKNPEHTISNEYKVTQKKRFIKTYYSFFSMIIIILVSLLTLTSVKMYQALTITYPEKMTITNDFTLYNDIVKENDQLFRNNSFFDYDYNYNDFFKHYELSLIKLEINDETFVQNLLNGEDTITINYQNHDYVINKENLTYTNHYLVIHFNQIKIVRTDDNKIDFYLVFKQGDEYLDYQIDDYQIILQKKS